VGRKILTQSIEPALLTRYVLGPVPVTRCLHEVIVAAIGRATDRRDYHLV